MNLETSAKVPSEAITVDTKSFMTIDEIVEAFHPSANEESMWKLWLQRNWWNTAGYVILMFLGVFLLIMGTVEPLDSALQESFSSNFIREDTQTVLILLSIFSVVSAFIGGEFIWRAKEDAGKKFYKRIMPRTRRIAKKSQRARFIAAQNFLNSSKRYAKLYEAYEKLSETTEGRIAPSNRTAMYAIQVEWSRRREEEVRVARFEEAKKKRERDKIAFEQERREQQEARKQKLLEEQKAAEMIEQLNQEIEIEEKGLVLTSVSEFDTMTARDYPYQREIIQDKVKHR